MEQGSVVDGDGHLVEALEDLGEHLDPAVRFLASPPAERTDSFSRRQGVFPSLDGWHYPSVDRLATSGTASGASTWERASGTRRGSPEDVRAFCEEAGIADTVLYPTEGLSVGNLQLPEYAVQVCRAYNDYVAAAYAAFDDRLHPVALLPMADPAAAAAELRRAHELGLVAAMLPSTGLPLHHGHECYWPVYAVADELGMALGIHGGANAGILHLSSFSSHAGARLLWHPLPLVEALVALVYHGVFDRFRGLRVAFLEGGAAWTALVEDRMARDVEFFAGAGRSLADYCSSGQILIGCEGNDPSLPFLVSRLGSHAFAYSSDYPHEVDLAAARAQLAATRAVEELSAADRAAILGDNAAAFYGLPVPTA